MNKKQRNFLIGLAVVVAVFFLNKLTGSIFNGLANHYLGEFLNELKCAVIAFLGAVFLKKLWIYKRFDAPLLKKSWSTAIYELSLTVLLIILALSRREPVTAGPLGILLFVLMMICVGIYEETLCRGLLQNTFHKFFGEDTVEHVVLATVCAGIFFGLLHLANALQPNVSLTAAAIQALGACGAGIFYGAVYFRTGKNLWYVMLIHALHDTGSFLSNNYLSNGGDTSAIISQASMSNSVLSIIGQTAAYAVIALFLLRKSKVEPLLKKAKEKDA